MACLREFGILIISEEAGSIACDPMSVGTVRLELVDMLE
jgi:hypothetical protein